MKAKDMKDPHDLWEIAHQLEHDISRAAMHKHALKLLAMLRSEREAHRDELLRAHRRGLIQAARFVDATCGPGDKPKMPAEYARTLRVVASGILALNISDATDE